MSVLSVDELEDELARAKSLFMIEDNPERSFLVYASRISFVDQRTVASLFSSGAVTFTVSGSGYTVQLTPQRLESLVSERVARELSSGWENDDEA